MDCSVCSGAGTYNRLGHRAGVVEGGRGREEGKCGCGRGRERCVDETADVAHRGDQGARRRGDEGLDRSLFDAVGQNGDRDVVLGVPAEEVVSAIERETSTVEPMVGVEGVDLERFNHPADSLDVDVVGDGNPRGISVLRTLLSVSLCL